MIDDRCRKTDTISRSCSERESHGVFHQAEERRQQLEKMLLALDQTPTDPAKLEEAPDRDRLGFSLKTALKLLWSNKIWQEAFEGIGSWIWQTIITFLFPGGVADYYYFFFFSGVGGALMIIFIPFLSFPGSPLI